MFYKLIIPNQASTPIALFNNKITSNIRAVTKRYSDLFPADVIRDMGVDGNDPVVVTLHHSKIHLRWMYVGWPTAIEIACLRSDGTVGWRIAYQGWGSPSTQTVTDCFDGNRVGEIPPSMDCQISNLDNTSSGMTASTYFDVNGDYSNVHALNTDRTTGDLDLSDVALYINNLPIFRTWHPTHKGSGAKYSTDRKAFLELHLNDPTRTVPTYELQMNDASSYGQSSYDDAAFVFYTLD